MLSAKAKQIADEAKRQKKWLYEPLYKKWYTPEEFKHIFNYADATDDFIKRLQIRHPYDGINAGFQRLSEMQEKLKIFVLKVAEYYKT